MAARTINLTSASKSLGQKLIANTLSNVPGQAFKFVLALVVTPYVVHHLGDELDGLIALIGTIAGFAGLLNLDVGTALAKYVSELYWKQDFKRIDEPFHSALREAEISARILAAKRYLAEKHSSQRAS